MTNKIKYTAFVDILGFSDHIEKNITNDTEAKKLYENINNKLINYFKYVKIYRDKFLTDEGFNNNIFIDYTWVSDTFIITIEYDGDKSTIEYKAYMIYILSIIIAETHHFFAKEYSLTLRGGISSKYSFINEKVILGAGITESHKLENIATYPRVIFADDIITKEIIDFLSKIHNDNDLNIISKDCDGYYFVNYIGALQDMPPMIDTPYQENIDNIDEIIQNAKIDMIKIYKIIMQNGLNNKNLKIKSKYLLLENYIDRLLPTDGKRYNMFAFNLFSKDKQRKLIKNNETK